MGLSPIIQSLLDTDLYKFTMMQAVFHQFPAAQVEYEFRCRDKGIDLSPLATAVRGEISSLCDLKFEDDELEYLKGLRFIKPDFVDFLSRFRLSMKDVEVSDKDGFGNPGLSIKVRGGWLYTILFEVPILAIVNQLYFARMGVLPWVSEDGTPNLQHTEGMRRLEEKIKLIDGYSSYRVGTGPGTPFLITDFGTRRRICCSWQENVVRILAEKVPSKFVGTSNVLLAKKTGLKPFGTMAHEWLQAMQAMVRVSESQKFAFQKWADEYRGDLGIALSDIVGMDAFLRDYDLYFCKLFDGARHDSGDPFEWTEKLIAHYKLMRIDPKTKRAVYSDGLTVPKAIELHKKFSSQIEMGFGIGTNLTNDCGPTPINIVMKMTRCNGQAVAKVSDARGKTICQDANYLVYLMDVFQIKG